MADQPKKLPAGEFQAIYKRVPRLCVDIVIQSKQGVALAKRDIPPAQGMWHLPGGTVLFQENLSEAVARIAQEETGLELKINRVGGIIEYGPDFAFGHSVAVVYLAQPVSGKLRGYEGAREIGYFSKAPANLIPEQEEFLLETGLLQI